MTTAIILAGGTGLRMQPIELPKQFIILAGKPIIAHTLSAYDAHPDIDQIIIACLAAWIPACEGYIYEYGIKKVTRIVPGGATGHASIRNALEAVASAADEKDIVLIHDSVRPLVSREQITQCVQTVKTFGSAVAVVPCNTAMMVSEDGVMSARTYDRRTLFATQTPQGFYVNDLMSIHKKAQAMGIQDSVASCTLAAETGGQVYFCPGDDENIKITTQSDLKMARAIMLYRKMGEPATW